VVVCILLGLWVSQSEAACSFTDWFDRDDPTGFADAEVCSDQIPCTSLADSGQFTGCPFETIEIRRNGAEGDVFTTAEEILNELGEVVSITHEGMVCLNANQTDGTCNDYSVRFCCSIPDPEPTCSFSDWFDRDDPSGFADAEICTDEYPCTSNSGQFSTSGCPFASIEIRVNGDETNVFTTADEVLSEIGEVVTIDSEGMVCLNVDQTDGTCSDYSVRFCCPDPDPVVVPLAPAPVPAASPPSCPDNCKVCSKRKAKKCKKCNDGFRRMSRGTECSPDIPQTCEITNCAVCSFRNPTKCRLCADGFRRHAKRSQCKASSPCLVDGCGSCYSRNPNRCRKCLDGYEMLIRGECTLPTPQETFYVRCMTGQLSDGYREETGYDLVMNLTSYCTCHADTEPGTDMWHVSCVA